LRPSRPAAARPVSPSIEPPAPPSPPPAPSPLPSPPLEELLQVDPTKHTEVEPYEEPYDDDVAELIRPESPEAWDLNEKYVETSLLRLNVAMMRSGVRATEIDTRLRLMGRRVDAGTVQRSLDELITDCELYLAEQRDGAERLHSRIGELGELKWLGEEVETANLEQAAQVETTLGNLRDMDFQADLEAAAARLVTEIGHLRQARHKLRDSQEKAFLVIARYENRVDKIEKQLLNDPLTEIRNRIGLETVLWEWWRQGRHRSRSVSAAMFDLDRFGRVNTDHGSLVGDRILRHFAQSLRKSLANTDLAARYGGQRFVAFSLDNGLRAGAKTMEFVRQTLERTTFRHNGKEIRLTACGAVTEAMPDEGYEVLLDRLETTLHEAKQAGANRSCFHRGGKIEPVESPSLGAEYEEVVV
jgi:two-component system cell cycle response regulator